MASAFIKCYPREALLSKCPLNPPNVSKHPFLTYVNPAFFFFLHRRVEIYVLVFACNSYSHGFRCKKKRKKADALLAPQGLPVGLGEWTAVFFPWSLVACRFCKVLLRRDGVKRKLEQEMASSLPS